MYYKKNLDFVALIWEDLAYQIDNKDSKKQDKMFYPRFTKIIIHHFLEKDKSISMKNRVFMHTAWDDILLDTMRFVSRHEDTQVYGVILPKTMMNQAMLDSVAYKTYYAIASGAEPPKSKKSQKKSDSAISFSKKKPASKPKLTKKKALVKADKGKGLNVFSEVALSKAAQLKVATKRSKKDFHISQASSTSDGTNFQLGVPDEQQRKISESWGDSGEEDVDDEDDTEDDEGNDDGNDSDGNDDDDDNDGDDDDDNDGNDDDDSDHERTESDRDENPNLNQFNEEHEEEENVDEFTDKEDDEENENKLDDDQHDVSKEYGFEQEEEDAHVTLTTVHDIQKTEGPMQSFAVLSDFTEKLLNFKNVSPANNEIASLMDTTVRNEEPSGQTSTLFTVPIMVIPTTIPPPPHFFNPLPQQTTPTPTPIASEVTTAFPALPDFASVFRFNDRVTNLERDLSEIKQVDQYAQAISSIPAIVDRYMDNKLGEDIYKAIQEEVKTQLPHILPKAVSDFATPVIEQNVTESLEAAILARELYDALVKSYNTDKDLFKIYGEVFTLKRRRDEKDKDQDPSVGSDRETKRRKSSMEAGSPKDL
ncbi:hypothetical protein Tco_1376730, partial [Tanacetum coccineum]